MSAPPAEARMVAARTLSHHVGEALAEGATAALRQLTRTKAHLLSYHVGKGRTSGIARAVHLA